MGYQAYTHKLITGRRELFGTLKQLGGISGFSNKDESPKYDLFTCGHGGTCLSTAMGLAVAAQKRNEDKKIVAIIGDASLGEGMALEALNHIGHVKPNLLVILNDNKMSIATPVGGLSRYLNRIITNPLYNRIRQDFDRRISRLPKGKRLLQMGHRLEESLKGLLVPGLLFEELGFRYVGPVNGHDFRELISTLKNVKRLKGPILLHVSTIKGKGYLPAEQNPEKFHKAEPFDLITGEWRTSISVGKSASEKSRSDLRSSQTFTDAFSEEIIRLASSDERILAITAAMPEGTGLAQFRTKFPDRFIDVGMAEQHSIGLAAGLARAGLRPVVAIYSSFMQRAYDQIMHEVSLQRLPVVLCLDRGGLVGEDGPTHHGVFDISYLRSFPHLAVLSPKDPDELKAMLRWALKNHSPVAIRYSRGGIAGSPLNRCARMTAGRSELLREGNDISILALGCLVYPALEVAQRLSRENSIEASVVNARFVKPLDRSLLRQVARNASAIVTLEEAQISGGFGSAVCECLDSMGVSGIPLFRIGIGDEFVTHGKRSELLKLCGFDAEGLYSRILKWVQSRRSAAFNVESTK
jgi:1-deoxy-D-xylulose-5-phosphate synthase